MLTAKVNPHMYRKTLPDPDLPDPPFLSVTGDGGSPEGTGLKPAAALPPSVHNSIFTPAEREEAATSAPVRVWPLLSDRWTGSWSTGQTGPGNLLTVESSPFSVTSKQETDSSLLTFRQ